MAEPGGYPAGHFCALLGARAGGFPGYLARRVAGYPGRRGRACDSAAPGLGGR